MLNKNIYSEFLCVLLIINIFFQFKIDAQERRSINEKKEILTGTSHIISSKSGINGGISPNGEVLVTKGENKSFYITPDVGFMIDKILVDNIEVEPTNEIIINVNKIKHSINVTFKPSKVWTFGDIKVSNCDNINYIAGGTNHILGINIEGKVKIIGSKKTQYNFIPKNLNEVIAIDILDLHAVALKKNGKIVDWLLDGRQIIVPDEMACFTSAVAGQNFTIALKDDGKLIAWDISGSVIATPINLRGVVGISSGGPNMLALMYDGTVREWDKNSPNLVKKFEGLTDVIAISGGYNHTLALLKDGSVVEWLRDSDFQPTRNGTVKDITSIAAGPNYNLALKNDGSVITWQNNLSKLNQTKEIMIGNNVPFVKSIATGGNTLILLTK